MINFDFFDQTTWDSLNAWAWNLVCGRFINFRNGRKILILLTFGCPGYNRSLYTDEKIQFFSLPRHNFNDFIPYTYRILDLTLFIALRELHHIFRVARSYAWSILALVLQFPLHTAPYCLPSTVPTQFAPFSYKNKNHLFKKTHLYRTVSDFLCLTLQLSVYPDQSYQVTYCR